MSRHAALVCIITTLVSCQCIDGWGVSGGDGHRGGIGDGTHPVLLAQAYVTDGLVPTFPNSTRQLASGEPPVLTRNNSTADCYSRKVVVDSTLQGSRQEMLGFGHAWTDSTIDVFDTLEPIVLDQLMHELFGQDGNNMGFMRHTIGSSDLSQEQYSYDDNGPSFNEGQPDPTLSNFNLGPHGTRMAQYLAKMGHYKGDVFLYGAPWSYPGWMKNNDLFVAPNFGGSHFFLNNSFNPTYIPQTVQYFSDYVDAYKGQGVTINGISPQNEPLNYQGGTTTMFLDAVDEANLLIRGLGSAMHERGVKVLAYDHNTDQPAYPARVIQGAGDLVDAAAWHCYQGPVADYTILEDFRQNFPRTPQFMTECSNTAVHVGTTNFWVAQNFIPAVRYGASGASFWVLATDPTYGPRSPYGGCPTCSGSVFVNSSTTYEKTIDFYMIGHFSRFIRRGATNFHITQGLEGGGTDWNAQFWAIATQNPDKGWAVVFLNTFAEDQYLDLYFTGSGFSWRGTIPALTVVTWLLPSDQVLARNATLRPSASMPLYPRSNRTSSTTGSSSMVSGSAFLLGTGSTSTCTITSTASSSSMSPLSGTYLPVPHTTHRISLR